MEPLCTAVLWLGESDVADRMLIGLATSDFLIIIESLD